jgi:hypothetical protein
MTDEDNNDISSFDTSYNYDDRNDKFVEEKTGYENVILKCGALGGRPQPTFKWYIENNNEDLKESDDIDIRYTGNKYRGKTGFGGTDMHDATRSHPISSSYYCTFGPTLEANFFAPTPGQSNTVEQNQKLPFLVTSIQ